MLSLLRSMLLMTVVVLFIFTLPAANAKEPIRLIYDTDIGNDVDDVLALGVIHALQDLGECRLLAVTITKDHELCAPFVDAVNTFYGRADIPIGVVRNGPTPNDSRFLPLARERDQGTLRYPHDLLTGTEAEEATRVLRRVLARQPDHSVVIVQVGFSTNLARLLDSESDEYSDKDGTDLARTKVRLLSAMAGAFKPIDGKQHREYNVAIDIPSARRLAARWPTPIIYSGYEIGIAIRYPAKSVERDFTYVKHHPLPESYQLYKHTPHQRPCWDLTSVLYAVRPERDYFDRSSPGEVVVNDDGSTHFVERATGRHQYLIADPIQVEKVRETLVQLASRPPDSQAHE